jgi:hypothetical protein
MKQPKSVKAWAVATKAGRLVGNPWNSRVPYIFSSELACRTMAQEAERIARVISKIVIK